MYLHPACNFSITKISKNRIYSTVQLEKDLYILPEVVVACSCVLGLLKSEIATLHSF